MSPASNGIVRYIDVKDSVHDFSDLRSGKGFEDREVEDKGDSRFREVQFPPRKRDREMRIYGLNWVRGYVKRLTW